MTVTSTDLRSYLTGTLNFDLPGVADADPLFSSGLVDSFAMIDLITFLESQGGFRIPPADITLDNFDTLERIVAFMTRNVR